MKISLGYSTKTLTQKGWGNRLQINLPPWRGEMEMYRGKAVDHLLTVVTKRDRSFLSTTQSPQVTLLTSPRPARPRGRLRAAQ